MSKHNCRICGLYIEPLPWGENDNCPTYEICPCCGVEFGCEDYSLDSIICYRKKWIKEGLPWFDPRKKTANWSFEEQKKYIPKDFLDK